MSKLSKNWKKTAKKIEKPGKNSQKYRKTVKND